ncbi:MAG: hypothetical protein Q9168_003360 [Polycauliona sp. 1 TL-2023]
MSPTNIRKAWPMLDRAGTSFDDQATIEPFGLPVYTVFVEEFPQETLDKYAKLLNHGIEGQWLSDALDPTKAFGAVDPSLPSKVPKLCISGVLKNRDAQSRYIMSNPPPGMKEPLDFLLVVQGKNASERSKIVVEHKLEDAATSMLHEAINGYSVVFTGAILRSDSNKLFSQTGLFELKKVPDIAALNDFDSHGLPRIRIIC